MKERERGGGVASQKIISFGCQHVLSGKKDLG